MIVNGKDYKCVPDFCGVGIGLSDEDLGKVPYQCVKCSAVIHRIDCELKIENCEHILAELNEKK